jgi:hypothetical protein
LAGRAIQELQIQGRRNKVDIQRGVTEIVAQWGHSYLGNNAGVSGLSLVDDPDDSKWFNILDTNLSWNVPSHRNISTRKPSPVCPSGDFSMKSPSWFVILPWIKPMGITGQAINICGGQTLV